MVWNKQESRRKYWATRSCVRLFARTAHFAHSLVRGKVNFLCLKMTWFCPIVSRFHVAVLEHVTLKTRFPLEGPIAMHYGIETGNLRRNLLSLFNNSFFCLNGYKYVFKQYNSHRKVLEAIWVLPGTSSGSSTASLEGSTTTSNLASCQHLSTTSL